MIDLNGRYGLAGERVERLRAEAARERLVRSGGGPHGLASLRTILGDLLIRAGRALGGDRRGKATTERPRTRGARHGRQIGAGPGHDNGTWVVSLTGAPVSRSPSPPRAGMSAAWMARSVPRDGLDRLLRDLDRLGREPAAGEMGEG